ncbi:DUF6277 family protein [Herbaspirillum autotrophicum]|uniref:DUF6277 family protein n=1 Tax=Herbaspirillum autotrophicum TaxID=180195 RepID=UPI00067A80C6|nr:DUF6277 family protein [Herbaspirillum autotrophicum]
MIDPKEIMAACNEMHGYGQSAGSSLSESFINAIPDMSVASTSNASNMIGTVQQVGNKMLEQMSNIKSSIDKQVAAHQDAQRRQKTYDFDVNMSDLTPTNAVGFPQELPENFFAPFKTGK